MLIYGAIKVIRGDRKWLILFGCPINLTVFCRPYFVIDLYSFSTDFLCVMALLLIEVTHFPFVISLADDVTTPRRDLAPPIEEDEEHSSLEIHERPPPLQEIENNISALLRGDLALPRCTSIDLAAQRRTGFRLGEVLLFECSGKFLTCV